MVGRAVQSKFNERKIYSRPIKNKMLQAYEPYIMADDKGIITICVGGECIGKPIEQWFNESKNTKERPQVGKL